MSVEIVSTAQAPQAIGPYSQAVSVGSNVYTAGQIGLDPAKMELVPGGGAQQTDPLLRHLPAIGMSTAHLSLRRKEFHE